MLGLVLSSILTRDGLISALVVALFTLNALLILVRQDKKEEAGSMAVLKGK
ncbi:immunity protein [Streptococcus pneumoniae]|nr:immunity protein [Streptococcus pneumoniae]